GALVIGAPTEALIGPPFGRAYRELARGIVNPVQRDPTHSTVGQMAPHLDEDVPPIAREVGPVACPAQLALPPAQYTVGRFASALRERVDPRQELLAVLFREDPRRVLRIDVSCLPHAFLFGSMTVNSSKTAGGALTL